LRGQNHSLISEAPAKLGREGAKFRNVRQSNLTPSKQKFAVTCVRLCVRAAGRVRVRFEQDKWK